MASPADLRRPRCDPTAVGGIASKGIDILVWNICAQLAGRFITVPCSGSPAEKRPRNPTRRAGSRPTDRAFTPSVGGFLSCLTKYSIT